MVNQFRMDLYFVIYYILFHLIQYAEPAFRFSRHSSNWTEAADSCKEFGGYLATIDDFQNFQIWIDENKRREFLTDMLEVWVGARLKKSQWKWEGETGTIYKDVNSYKKLGCFHGETWFQNGSQLQNITPESCLQHCRWQGIVGLQKNKCLCEEDIGNLSKIRRGGICHIACAGNTREMCGGFRGISVFQPASNKITWTGDEDSEHNCVLLRRRSRDPEWHLRSSNCDLQTRYLCSFRDHPKCGDYHVCLRWSTDQATWTESKSKCESMSGHLAELANGFGDYSQDLYALPPGSYWLSLRRNQHWMWINGSRVPPSNFFNRGFAPAVSDRTCAVLHTINGQLGLSAKPCHLKRHFLCQYDFEDKFAATRTPALKIVTKSHDNGKNKMATIQYEATWRRNPFFDLWDNVTITLESQTDTSESDRARALLNTCMYLLLGFVSGIVCVLIIGLLVYLVFRCRQPDPKKHNQLKEDASRHDNQSVTYSSKDESIHIPSPPPDITYDSVYDGESPFRRNQRLIKMGSANTWRPAVSPRRQRLETQRPGTPSSLTSDYMWRGMIDGQVEILNTQLRHQQRANQNSGNYFEAEFDFHNTNEHGGKHSLCRKISVNPRASIHDQITTDLDELENHYDIPERLMRETSEPTRRLSSTSGNRRSSALSTGSDLTFPKFLELENQVDEFSNEENIYASIKKTFQRIEKDLDNSKTGEQTGSVKSNH